MPLPPNAPIHTTTVPHSVAPGESEWQARAIRINNADEIIDEMEISQIICIYGHQCKVFPNLTSTSVGSSILVKSPLL